VRPETAHKRMKILRYLANDKNADQISRIMRCSSSSILQHVKGLGLKKHHPRDRPREARRLLEYTTVQTLLGNEACDKKSEKLESEFNKGRRPKHSRPQIAAPLKPSSLVKPFAKPTYRCRYYLVQKRSECGKPLWSKHYCKSCDAKVNINEFK